VSIRSFVKPWSGRAVRHVSEGYDIYDFSHCDKSKENRWNIAGQSTLYVAKSEQVAMAEYGRHFRMERQPNIGEGIRPRIFYRFQVELDSLLDLRDPELWPILYLDNAPHCFQDKETARAIAYFIRKIIKTQALLVPSMAFPDDLEQWCLVLFLENIQRESNLLLQDLETLGKLDWHNTRHNDPNAADC
jgi:RES domain-containing protein